MVGDAAQHLGLASFATSLVKVLIHPDTGGASGLSDDRALAAELAKLSNSPPPLLSGGRPSGIEEQLDGQSCWLCCRENSGGDSRFSGPSGHGGEVP